ncbi:MAG TPA: toprim domain-containing protein [Terriglobia bacterium]|nr:toprim domain-containing protein [Terriglobia bacterium]
MHLSGRTLDRREPKYLHLPGQINYLFNEDALFADEVLVTESPTDCIFAEQKRYGAVALFGTSLKLEHAAKFSRCRTPYLCLDGDDAGVVGVQRVGEIIGERAKVIRLPEGLDLDEYLKKYGTAGFDALKTAAPGIFKFELDLIPAETDKTELPQALEPLLKRVARVAEVKAEAFLNHEIKPRFGLTTREISGYLKLMSGYRAGEGAVSDREKTHATNEPGTAGPYRVQAGHICVERMTHQGAVTVPLCNFVARVVEELVFDDGVETTRSFAIEGKLENGTRLPLIRVPVAQFNGMAWVTQNWGRSAIVSAGLSVRDQLREAIQRLSQSAPQRRVLTHTGWREIEGQWVFLTAAGAVGGEGLEVILDSGLSRYRLPKKAEDVVEAVRTSLRLLRLGPLSVTVPLFSAVYRAPLAAVYPVDLSLWLEGQTGSLKSTLAALFLSHFGEFDRTNLPGAWTSTANHLERRAFTLKDLPFVIDDYAPSAMDARELETKTSRLLRAQGNLQGRGSLRADLTERPEYPPRGLIISTGEQHPPGQSILARTPIVEVQRSTIDLAALSEAQQSAARLPHAMSGYLAWLAPQMSGLPSLLRTTFEGTRKRATAEGQHLRVPEAIAHLWLGLQCALTYAEEISACPRREAEDLNVKCWKALVSLGRAQNRLVEGEKPSRRFLRVIFTLLTQGRARFSRKDQPTAMPSNESVLSGWYDEHSLYLNPDAAFQAVARFCRDTGEGFPVREARLMSDLHREGLSDCDPGRHNTTVSIGGRSQRALKLNRHEMESLLNSELPIEDTTVTGITTITGFQEERDGVSSETPSRG